MMVNNDDKMFPILGHISRNRIYMWLGPFIHSSIGELLCNRSTECTPVLHVYNVVTPLPGCLGHELYITFQ